MRKCLVTLTIVFACINTTFALDGLGTEASPWLIQSLADFDQFTANSDFWDDYTSLEADIDLTGRTYTTAPIAYDPNSFGTFAGISFTGVFDGNSHTISNLTINGTRYLGLFGYIDNGSVTNLAVENVDIYGTGNYIGGLCGWNDSGTISDCYATGSINGGSNLGGLCGYNDSFSIGNCYATASVNGGSNLGGLCGTNAGIIRKCYATGLVAGDNYLGGLCGYSYGGSETIRKCYFYLLGGPDNNLGTALNDSQLIDSESFVGFDFAGNPDDGTYEDWDIIPGHCPKLSWQTDDGPLPPNTTPNTSLLGSGISNNPFQINTAADFNEFISNARLICGYFVLNTDIDLAAETFDTAVINRFFGGHFEGAGHLISNITINTAGADTDYLGLFSKISASVSNLGIENISITGGDSSDYIGGLCGKNESGTISNCYATGSVTGAMCLGGLCGKSYYGNITNCYSTCTVDGEQSVGGLCGENEGYFIIWGPTMTPTFYDSIITNCYSTGTVTGTSNVGGLVSDNNIGTVNNSFWDTDTSGMTTSAGGTGKTTTEMQDINTFLTAGWDFENVWDICDGTNYPKFIWQIPTGDIICPDGVTLVDFATFSAAWLTSTGQPDYNDDCDLVNDDTINLADLAILAENFLQGI